MARLKNELDRLEKQTTENKIDIEIIQDGMQRQIGINESAADAFEKGALLFDELDRKIRFLKKLAAGLAFISGGLFVMLMKDKAEIQEIRKVMNEG